MKILSLHFANINSLSGEWTVRFDDPAFLRNHLFAISGPTGSGKTSVLDAISLALYGKTPRQENIADKRNTEIGPELVMTAGTGNSFSEVEFESSGSRYKARWEVHRSRNSADGEVQPVKRKLLFEEGGAFSALEEVSKNNEVQRKIEEIVGLNFSQFMRAVMLPQGGFDSFLKSKRDEKAAILEKLSGQEIYRSISKAVYARNKKENEYLAQINQKISEIRLLPEAEEKDLSAWLGAAEKTRKSKESELRKNEEAERILNEVEQVEKNCQKLRTAVEELSTADRNLENSRKRLSRDEDAQKLIAPLENLERLRKEQAAQKAQKDEIVKKIPEMEMRLRQEATALETKKKEEERLGEDNKKRDELRERVSSLDSDIYRDRKVCDEKKAQIEKLSSKLETLRLERMNLDNERLGVEKTCEENETYANAHPTHKMLESEKSVISDRLKLLGAAKDDVVRAKDALAISKNQYGDAEVCCRSRKRELKIAEDERNRGLSNDMNKIAMFLQTTLVEGARCPVCGSPFHVTHTAQKFSPGEVTATAERLNHLQRRYEEARKESEEAEYQLKIAEGKIKACEKDFSDKANVVSEYVLTTIEKLKPYGFSEKDLDEPSLVLSKIQHWATQWTACIKNIDACHHQLSVIQVQKKSLDENEANARNELSLLNKDLDEKKKSVQALVAERQKLFGTVDVAEDRRSWQNKIDAVAMERSKLFDGYVQTGKFLGEQKVRLETISAKLMADERNKECLESDFQAKLRGRFASETDLRHAVISKAERDLLLSQIEKVETDLATRKGQLIQEEERLKQLRQKESGRETLQTVRSKIDTLVKELKDLGEAFQEKQRRFLENEFAKKTSATARVEKDSQEKVVLVWNTLNDLIGSADGKKFVEYVQQLTLRKLILAANRHLHGLDPRYKIETDKTGLNISLYDSECGASRLAANLSGGESFLVSLSLALGLSSLASQRVRIDTLFLDEGFGSLDERKLQKAIELLHRLGESGDKLVGVISHVNRLKEEISNHIEVIPSGNGRSKLSGPGVLSGK